MGRHRDIAKAKRDERKAEARTQEGMYEALQERFERIERKYAPLRAYNETAQRVIDRDLPPHLRMGA